MATDSTLKHTPGPFQVLQPQKCMDSEEWQGLMILDAQRHTLAEVFSVDVGDVQANARLFAVAPDLLAAAEAVDTFFVFFDSIVPPHLAAGAREALGMVSAALVKVRHA